MATPLDLSELDDPVTRPDRWTLRTIGERLERDGDRWKQIGRHRYTLTRAEPRLREALAEIDG